MARVAPLSAAPRSKLLPLLHLVSQSKAKNPDSQNARLNSARCRVVPFSCQRSHSPKHGEVRCLFSHIIVDLSQICNV